MFGAISLSQRSHRCLCHPCSRLTRLAELAPNKNASSTHESRASDWPAPDPPHHGQIRSRWRRVRTSAHPLAARLGKRLGHLSEQSLRFDCASWHQGNCGQGDCVGVHSFSSDLGHTSQYDCMCRFCHVGVMRIASLVHMCGACIHVSCLGGIRS